MELWLEYVNGGLFFVYFIFKNCFVVLICLFFKYCIIYVFVV